MIPLNTWFVKQNNLMNQSIVELSTIKFEGRTHIRLDFPYNKNLVRTAKYIGCKWNQDFTAWHIINNPVNQELIGKHFSGKAIVNLQDITTDREPGWISTPKSKVKKAHCISEDVLPKINDFEHFMKVNRYSPNSIETYLSMIKVFFSNYNLKPYHEITNEDIAMFNSGYILYHGFSISYQRQMISAIKLFYGRIMERQLDLSLLKRPFRERKLPVILSEQEIADIIQSIDNLKHKSLISVAYACGITGK